MDPRPPLRLPQQRQPRQPPRVFDPSNAQYEMIAEAAHTVRTELSLLFSNGGELLSDTDSDADFDFDLDNNIKSRSNNIRPEELENEISILRSFLEYFYSKRTFPFSNPNTAVDFVCSGATMSLDDFDFNSRRLKNRYKKRLWKIGRNFQLLENAREQHAFELGNRLWGSMSVEMMMANQEDQQQHQQQDDETMASADETLTIASADETLTLGSADETLTMASVEEEKNLEAEEHGDDGKKDGDNKGDGKDDGDNKADDKKDGDNKGYGKAIDKGKAVAVDYKGDEKEDGDDKGDGKDADNKGNEEGDADNKDGVMGECPLLKNEIWFENGVLKLPVVSKEAVEEGLESFGEDRVKNWEKRWKELEIEELNAFLARVNTIRHYANILKDELQSKTYPHGEAELGS